MEWTAGAGLDRAEDDDEVREQFESPVGLNRFIRLLDGQLEQQLDSKNRAADEETLMTLARPR